jgi:cell division protein FtsQ
MASRRSVIPGVAAPADKRFRRSDLRPDRRRWTRSLVRAARWIALGAAAAAVGFWLVHAALQARVLAVEHVTVRGNHWLSAGEVQALVTGIRGENIFRVDVEAYRKRLLDSPWLADVTLWRVLPSTIDIRVVERVPMAIARLGQQLYLVDNTGVIIDVYGAPYRTFDLPIVDGLVSSPAMAGPLVEQARVLLTGALLTALVDRPDLSRRLSQIDVSNPHDAVVMFDNDTVWLHLGERRFLERLTTYLELAPALNERFVGLDYVDLRFDERVFVRSRGRTDQKTAVVR